MEASDITKKEKERKRREGPKSNNQAVVIMYVTRPLSLYRESPSALSMAPPEGPNSGILVIKDEAAESKWLFGMLKDETVSVPPFPQNKKLWLSHTMPVGTNSVVNYIHALFIPALNHLLSSNQYYIIQSRGSQKGLAYVSSRDEGRSKWLGVADAALQRFDPTNTYQQFEVSNDTFCGKPNGFNFKSVAADGITPYNMTLKGWRAYTKAFKHFQLTEALGLDATLRARLPQLTFSLPCKSSSPVVVGKWYCPFIFVRDGEVDTQIKTSPYYEMTLQQNWEEIFGCGNSGTGGRGVDLGVSVEREVVSVAGRPVVGINVGDGIAWFGSSSVGLSLAIVERIKWEEERGGFEWVGREGGEKEVNVQRREEFEGVGMWRRFGCYVLVERFVLKRMDGTVVLTWEFRHIHQIRTKWE